MPRFNLCRELIATWRSIEDVPYDVWGSALKVAFVVAGQLFLRHEVPDEWQYNPGLSYSGGKPPEEDLEVVLDYDLDSRSVEELTQFGHWLVAVRDGAEKNGKGY